MQPNKPEKEKTRSPYRYRYISSIGAFRNTRIVIIGYRVKENDPREYDNFRAFSYDVTSHAKREIEPKGYYYQWSFLTKAAFELSVSPDIVFKFFNCLECESVELLSSFRFDEKENIWRRRTWPDNDTDLMIGSDRQYGGEDDWVYDCLYKVTDINSDNFADIAIRCRETAETTRTLQREIEFVGRAQRNPTGLNFGLLSGMVDRKNVGFHVRSTRPTGSTCRHFSLGGEEFLLVQSTLPD